MKVLFICNKSPYPAKEGGPIAMNMFVEGLCDKGHQVKVLTVSSEKFNILPDKIPHDYRNKTNIEAVHINLRLKPLNALRCFVRKESYHIYRFISKDFEHKLIDILSKEEFDIIQFESIFVTPYLQVARKHSNARMLLRTHNVEHIIWDDIAKNSKNPFKKFYLKHLSRTLREYEFKALNKFDGILCITENDKAKFEKHCHNTPIISIPFGIKPEEYLLSKKNIVPSSVFHLGAMNWIPNLQGIEWFIKKVWPALHQQIPEVTLYIAGSFMPEHLLKIEGLNIVAKGFIENPKEFMNTYNIMLVPLFSSSGIRIKIIEGMALGKIIISTTKGAIGIEYEDGKNIIIADTKEDFIKAIKKCIANKKYSDQIGKEARKLIETKYNHHQLINQLIQFYDQIKS